MGLSTFRGDYIDAALRQQDATKISVVSGHQHVAYFDLGDDFQVVYVFDITAENRFFLQRAAPYPMLHARFTEEKEMLAFIKKDLRAFRNAKRSSNFDQFIGSVCEFTTLGRDLERLFMEHNVSREDLAVLRARGAELRALLQEVERRSPELEEMKK